MERVLVLVVGGMPIRIFLVGKEVDMLGELLSGGMKLLGGILGDKAADKRNEMEMAQAAANRQAQYDFAQSGIQWKTADALKAGIHPLFALGASTHSFAPVSVGLESKNNLASALGDMGQDVSRAVAGKSSRVERASMVAQNALVLEGMKLDNDIKRAKLASDTQKLAQPAVGAPVPEESSPEKRPQLFQGGDKIKTDPGFSNAEDMEKRYGEITDWVHGAPLWLREFFLQTEESKAERWMKNAVGNLFGIGGNRR